MFVHKIYPSLPQTFVSIFYIKFSWYSSFDLYTKCTQKFVEMWYTFGSYIFWIHFVYINYIHLVQFLYIKCVHSFRKGFYHCLKYLI